MIEQKHKYSCNITHIDQDKHSGTFRPGLIPEYLPVCFIHDHSPLSQFGLLKNGAALVQLHIGQGGTVGMNVRFDDCLKSTGLFLHRWHEWGMGFMVFNS